jgi:hypothetical protein
MSQITLFSELGLSQETLAAITAKGFQIILLPKRKLGPEKPPRLVCLF